MLIDPYPWDLEIRPATVATAITFALSRGWDPAHPQAPVILGYRNESFFALPSNIRFTHELAAASLDLAPTAQDDTSPPLDGLIGAVAQFSPWLDPHDLSALRNLFAELLLEPRRYWDALHQGIVVRTELRNLLLAHTQTFLGKVFQAPIPTEELEATLAASFDLVLFGERIDAPGTTG